MTNEQIAKIISEIGDFYAMKKIPWKPRAYEKAAEAIAGFDQALADLYEKGGVKALLTIPGVGKGIAEHLVELLDTGKLKIYKQLKKKTPVNLAELRRIPGLGPRTVAMLYEKLKITSLASLKAALARHQIAKLPGFGQKSEEQIFKALEFHSKESVRYPLGYIEGTVERLKQKLADSKLFGKIMVGGSYRRQQETVGDIDILATSAKPGAAMDFFVKLPETRAIIEHGKTRSEVRLANKMQVDLRIVPDESWGAAQIHFTGDLAHNVKMRKMAIAKGLKLSEYGLFRANSPRLPARQEKRIAKSGTEEEVYKALGMDWIPPEIRTDSGEIEAAQKGRLPKLLEYGSVKGDLQVQTNWTDGSKSIEEMARAAMDAGLQYIAITDHTKALAMTGGLDEKKLERQGREIDKLNTKLKEQSVKFRILKGAEVNILKDGTLDIADHSLKKLDVVGVSVHSHFQMSAEDMTKRLVRALSHRYVNIFFHPTTRIIGRRPSIEFGFDEILKVCKKNRVALEINSYPERLDIHDTLIRKAVAAGVKLVIDSDAHHPRHFMFLKYGEAQARRGWATKKDVLNAGPFVSLLEYFKK